MPLNKILTAFNTGRLYTKAGQRIAAEYDPQKRRILFSDTDRMVDGVIEQAGIMSNAREVESVTMHRYDYGQYDGASKPEDRTRIDELHKYARENAPTKEI